MFKAVVNATPCSEMLSGEKNQRETNFFFGVPVTSVQCVPVQAQYGSLAKIHSPQLLWKLQFATGSCTMPECDDTNNKPCLMRRRVNECKKNNVQPENLLKLHSNHTHTFVESSSICCTGCGSRNRLISSMMCIVPATFTAFCKRPSSANDEKTISDHDSYGENRHHKPNYKINPSHTRADKHHIVSPVEALHMVHSNLCVAYSVCEEHSLTFNRTVHQEVIFHKV